MRISAAIRNSHWPLVVEASVSVLLKKLGFESIHEPGLDPLPVLVSAVDLQRMSLSFSMCSMCSNSSMFSIQPSHRFHN